MRDRDEERGRKRGNKEDERLFEARTARFNFRDRETERYSEKVPIGESETETVIEGGKKPF